MKQREPKDPNGICWLESREQLTSLGIVFLCAVGDSSDSVANAENAKARAPATRRRKEGTIRGEKEERWKTIRRWAG